MTKRGICNTVISTDCSLEMLQINACGSECVGIKSLGHSLFSSYRGRIYITTVSKLKVPAGVLSGNYWVRGKFEKVM